MHTAWDLATGHTPDFLFFFGGRGEFQVYPAHQSSPPRPALLPLQPANTNSNTPSTGSNAHELKMEKQLILIHFLSSNDNEWSRLLLLYGGMSVFSICWCLGVIIWTFHYFQFWCWSFLKEDMWRGKLKKKKKSDTVRVFFNYFKLGHE